MTLTVKLDPALERDLDRHCKTSRLTKSEIVTRLLRQYFDMAVPKASAAALARKHRLIGSFSGGGSARGRDHSRLIKARLREQRAR